MTFSRDLLVQAFPDNPRLRAELEEAADALDAAQAQIQSLLATATDAVSRLTAIEGTSTQPYSELLTRIAESGDDRIGVFEKVGLDEINVREVDSADDACLVPRSKLVSYVGEGVTENRPALSATRRAIYWDTTLGKPVFWRGAAWHDFTGTAV